VKLFILIMIGVLALTSCSAKSVSEFYVVIKPEEAERFIGSVTAIAKKEGLETAMARPVSDTGNITRVVEGRGHGLKLWVQSMPLSGKEDPKLCGVHPEPYSDPAQFIVFTTAGFLGTKAAATDLGGRVAKQLQESGFDVRHKSPVCGAAAIHDHS
jgi:hypothetical protein